MQEIRRRSKSGDSSLVVPFFERNADFKFLFLANLVAAWVTIDDDFTGEFFKESSLEGMDTEPKGETRGALPIKVKVQPEALSAMTQFYDQHMRSFTFQDFQLTPTLEEYERILDQPLMKNSPYLY
ncbi:hypothetical protein CR513_52827, partial [Mucuna pruriens]